MAAVPPSSAPKTPRAGRKSPHGVLQVDWPLFGELCRALALRVFREYDPDLVIGIARAGVIPGAVVASILQRDFASIAISRRTPGAAPAPPAVLAGPPRLATGRRVLLVDETCDTGDTMKLALAAVRELRPAQVKTAVSFRTGDFRPDFHALETESFIILPWDREVIIDGEITVRPDYAEKLRELGA
ncbi:MAG: phosphoribosyltransferase [Gemmatimonadales bacterium]